MKPARDWRRAAVAAGMFLALTTYVYGQENTSDLFAGLGDAPAAAGGGSAAGAGSGPAAESPAAAGGMGGFDLRLFGDHAATLAVPASPDAWNFDGRIKSPRVDNQLGLELKAGDLKLVMDGLVTLSPGQGGPAASLSPGENAIYWNPAGFKLGLGWQYFAWGSADKKNPTDNLNARDYTVGLDAAKIPALALSATWYPADFLSVQGVYKPLPETAKYPVDFAAQTKTGIDTIYGQLAAAMYASAYAAGAAQVKATVYNTMYTTAYNGAIALGQSAAAAAAYAASYCASNVAAAQAAALTAQAAAIASGANGFVAANLAKGSVSGTREAANDPSSFVAGGRAAFTASGLDFSFSYLYDWDQFWTPVVTLGGGSYKYLQSVSLERKRIHRFGADIKTTVDKLGLWLEGAYNMTEDWQMNDPGIRNPSVAYTLGADLNFGPNDSCYLNLQYVGEVVLNYDRDFAKDYSAATMTAANLQDSAFMTRFYQRAMAQKLGLQTEGLTQGITAQVKVPLLDGLVTPSLTAAYVMPFLYDDSSVTRYGSLALKPEIDVMPVDSFHIKLGADLYYAWSKPDGGDVRLDTANDRVGAYNPFNNVYLKVEYAWNFNLKK